MRNQNRNKVQYIVNTGINNSTQYSHRIINIYYTSLFENVTCPVDLQLSMTSLISHLIGDLVFVN